MTKRQFVESKVGELFGQQKVKELIELVLTADGGGLATLFQADVDEMQRQKQAERDELRRKVDAIEAELARPVEAVFAEEPVAEAVDNPKVAEEQVL